MDEFVRALYGPDVRLRFGFTPHRLADVWLDAKRGVRRLRH